MKTAAKSCLAVLSDCILTNVTAVSRKIVVVKHVFILLRGTFPDLKSSCAIFDVPSSYYSFAIGNGKILKCEVLYYVVLSGRY